MVASLLCSVCKAGVRDLLISKVIHSVDNSSLRIHRTVATHKLQDDAL